MQEQSLSAPELTALLSHLHQQFGYDFSGYALSSVKRRLFRFMAMYHLGSAAALDERLADDPVFAGELIRALSVTVTEMFRDPSYYRLLKEQVISRLATYPLIKIWVAGCATGEEAYSLAIFLKEAGLLERSLIYATDINPQSVEVARKGIYPITAMKLYTSNYLQAGGSGSFSQYYLAHHGAVLLDESLKNRIVFSTHNLVSDAVFNEFQLITCRNVLIYFSPLLQNQVLDLFYESLCTFGFLCLGNRESLLFSGKKKLFEELSRKERIFIKSAKTNALN